MTDALVPLGRSGSGCARCQRVVVADPLCGALAPLSCRQWSSRRGRQAVVLVFVLVLDHGPVSVVRGYHLSCLSRARVPPAVFVPCVPLTVVLRCHTSIIVIIIFNYFYFFYFF